MKQKMLRLFLLVIAVPIANAAVPGTFFWKPRLGIDLVVRSTEASGLHNLNTRYNIEKGVVVLIDAYTIGLSVVALAEAIDSAKAHAHMNPLSAYYHTNAYRWFLRHLNLLPLWLAKRISYCDTHSVWYKRFFYMDAFVPKWMRKIFFYVDKREWDQEEFEYKRYKKYAEPAFGKHYRYPSKVFNDFKSLGTYESIENLDTSSAS